MISASRRCVTGSPAWWNTANMRVLCASVCATNRSIPRWRARWARRSNKQGAQSSPLPAVGHDERDLGVGRCFETVEAGDAHDLTCDHGDDRFAIAVVDVREPVQLLRPQLGMEGEVPQVGRLRRERVMEAQEPLGVLGPHHHELDRGAIA